MSSPPTLVALAELIEMLGLSKTRVMQLAASALFPKPVAVLRAGKIWAYADVVDFCVRTGRTVHPIRTTAAERRGDSPIADANG